MSEAEFILFRSLNTHEVLIIIEDTRILGCVADSLQERRFTSVGPSDHKDTKMSIFCSKIIGITVGHHGRRWVRVKRLRGNNLAHGAWIYEAYVSKIVYYTWTFGAQFHCLIDGVTYYI